MRHHGTSECAQALSYVTNTLSYLFCSSNTAKNTAMTLNMSSLSCIEDCDKLIRGKMFANKQKFKREY